ncbi:MAG: TPM domain-containing protein [Flavobacteriales bacterium]|nr:TPM domain-containing protein [Flavobacteriales bacterium]MCB9191035.1 TPM domain-containing protein [Flavobacteriales bacterium]MCB9203382.1 TPM domain-containing protein [Flavobacteriales bacterium]
MRGLLFIWLLAVSFISFGQDFPKTPDRLVNDYADALSDVEEQALEDKLVAFDNQTSVQIAIAILKTLDGYPIADYTVELFNEWKVGNAKYDNGVLILLSYEERKIWITSGYGVEGSLPDATLKRIIENEIIPQFKQNDYAGGLSAGADAIIAATQGEYQGAGNGGEEDPAPVIILVVGIIVLFWVIFWLIAAAEAKRYARLNGMSFWAAWALLNASRKSHSGSWGSFSGGSGGFGGGSFGGGGGFGGFGGGSSGGGGAGGSW